MANLLTPSNHRRCGGGDTIGSC